MADENKRNIDNLPKHVKENIDKQIDNAILHEQIKQDLLTNPKYDSFFEKYHKCSKEGFAETYKWKKASWIEYGDMYLKNEQDRMFKYKNMAEDCLWQIQQKKLFDFQCRWRAEQITTPEIKISWDFKLWENDIKNCSFIDPITEDEVELYKEFISSDDFERELYDYFVDWQDYDEYKDNHESDEEDSILPEWYQYYDSRMGTSSLLSLPDVRGKKEEFYRDLYFADANKKREEEKERQKKEGTYKETEIDKRPFMGAYNEFLDEFVNTFEDEKIKRYYRACEYSGTSIDEDEDLELAINALLESGEKIGIETNPDWREAVLIAARNYEKGKILEYMDVVYSEYLQRKQLGISYEKPKKDHDESLSKMIISQILHGRKLNGEPEDLNF